MRLLILIAGVLNIAAGFLVGATTGHGYTSISFGLFLVATALGLFDWSAREK